MQRTLFNLWCSILALVAALTLGGLILLYMGESPAAVYWLLLKGALGTSANISSTLEISAPYLFCGLSLAIAFQAGLFNIGAEGQLFAGALAGAIAGRYVDAPVLGPLTVLYAAALAGMLWAAIPAFLKIRAGVHEVINTIMLNYIMFALCSFLVRQPGIRVSSSMPRSADVAAAAQIGAFRLSSIQLDIGLLCAIGLAVVLWLFLRYTSLGFSLRVSGLQPPAARTAGIDQNEIIVLAFLSSGAIAGLAGGFFVASPLHPHFEMGFSPGWGFWGIALALLARNHPIGIIFAALLFGILETGGGYLDTARGIPRELIQILEAIIILMISSRLFPRLLDPDRRLHA